MRLVVYTAVFGGYDRLQPARFPSICLTDKTQPVANWEYVAVRSLLPPVFISRQCKMFPWRFLGDYEYSIYHDGNIEMLSPPEVVLGYLKDSDIAVFAHPDRNCVYEEGRACIAQHKAKADEVNIQLAKYRRLGYPENNGLAACWVLVRRHTPAIMALSEFWWQEFLDGAPRDQLSFDYCCWKLGINYSTIPGNLFKGTSTDFKRVKHARS